MGLVNEKMSEPSTYMAVVETVNYIDDGSDNESDKGTSSRSTKKDYKS